MFVLWCCARCAAQSRVVATEDDTALEVMEGWSSRKEHGSRRVGVWREGVSVIHAGQERPKRRGKENGGKGIAEYGVGGRKSGACGTQMRRSGRKAQGSRRRSRRWRGVRWACAEEEGGEARKDEPGLRRERRTGWWRGMLTQIKRQDHR
jgi:hypothetical protein